MSTRSWVSFVKWFLKKECQRCARGLPGRIISLSQYLSIVLEIGSNMLTLKRMSTVVMNEKMRGFPLKNRVRISSKMNRKMRACTNSILFAGNCWIGSRGSGGLTSRSSFWSTSTRFVVVSSILPLKSEIVFSCTTTCHDNSTIVEHLQYSQRNESGVFVVTVVHTSSRVYCVQLYHIYKASGDCEGRWRGDPCGGPEGMVW